MRAGVARELRERRGRRRALVAAAALQQPPQARHGAGLDEAQELVVAAVRERRDGRRRGVRDRPHRRALCMHTGHANSTRGFVMYVGYKSHNCQFSCGAHFAPCACCSVAVLVVKLGHVDCYGSAQGTPQGPEGTAPETCAGTGAEATSQPATGWHALRPAQSHQTAACVAVEPYDARHI